MSVETCVMTNHVQVECNTCTCSLLSTPVCTLADCSIKPACIPGDTCGGCYKSTPACLGRDFGLGEGEKPCGVERFEFEKVFLQNKIFEIN